MPLLVAMHEEREHDGARLLPLLGAARFFGALADETRRNINLTRIERTELVTGTGELMPSDFRSWRTTGCTWLAMLGANSYVIAQQAGHKSPDTTWAARACRTKNRRVRVRQHNLQLHAIPRVLRRPACDACLSGAGPKTEGGRAIQLYGAFEHPLLAASARQIRL